MIGCDSPLAKSYLKKTNFNMDEALDKYFAENDGNVLPNNNTLSRGDLANLENQFFRYAEKKSEIMNSEGIMKFCSDIGIDIMDPLILVFAYLAKAKTMVKKLI